MAERERAMVANLPGEGVALAILGGSHDRNDELREELKPTRARLNLRARLQVVLRHAVASKTGRVHKELKALGARNASIKHVKRALLPKNHLEDVLFDATVFMRELLPSSERKKHNFHVGIYMVVDGFLS
jgi:hypothetical protein